MTAQETQLLADRVLDLFGDLTLELLHRAEPIQTTDERRAFARQVAAAHQVMVAAEKDPVALTATAERFEALLAELRAGHDVNVAALLGVAPATDE
jgi:hypothetical protein